MNRIHNTSRQSAPKTLQTQYTLVHAKLRNGPAPYRYRMGLGFEDERQTQKNPGKNDPVDITSFSFQDLFFQAHEQSGPVYHSQISHHQNTHFDVYDAVYQQFLKNVWLGLSIH